MQPCCHATHAIAALARWRAVSIPDAVVERTGAVACRLHAQQLVETYTGMAVAQRADLRNVQRKRAIPAIQHDKIVADAVHFRKVQLHASTVVGRRSQDCALAGVSLLLPYAGSAGFTAGGFTAEGFTTGGFTVVEAFAG
jgi:hypothetical protein